MGKKKRLYTEAEVVKAFARKGGKARWEGVSKAERSKILRRAVLARWRKRRNP